MSRRIRVIALVVTVFAIGGVLPPAAWSQEPDPSSSSSPSPAPDPTPTPDPTPPPAETPTPAPPPTAPPSADPTEAPAPSSAPDPEPSAASPPPAASESPRGENDGTDRNAGAEASRSVPGPCELVDCAAPGSSTAFALIALLAEECDPSGCPLEVVESAAAALGLECGTGLATSCTRMFEELTAALLAGACDSPCANSALDLSFALAEEALTSPCPAGAASLCVSQSFEPATAYGAMVSGIVNGAGAAIYQRACGGSEQGCAAAYSAAMSDLVFSRIDGAYVVVCGLPGTGTCVEKQEMLARLLTWGHFTSSFELVCADPTSASCGSHYPEAVAGVVTALADQAATFVCGTATAATCAAGSRSSSFALLGTAVLPGCPSATACNQLVVQIGRGVSGTCGVTLETASASSMDVAGVSNPCVDQVVAVANSVLTVACGSTDAVTCANNLIETTNELLISVCSQSVVSSAAWASLAPPMWTAANVSHPCVDTTVAAVNLILRTACSSTDPVTCANNLVRTVNELLITACTLSNVGPDSSPPEVNGVEAVRVAHPCVERTFEAVNVVLTTTCGSTDLVTCANNLIRTVNELLVTACTLSNVGYDSSPPEVNGIELLAVAHPCVERAFEAVNSVLVTACDSTDAATCAQNLIRTIDALLVSACTESIGSSETAPPRVVNGIQLTVISHACVDTAFAVVNLVLETACDSTDPATCADNLIREINALLVRACTLSNVGYDSSPPEVNGIELLAVAHPCVERAFEAVNSVLVTACGSTDAVTCAQNLVRTIDELLVSVCTQSIASDSSAPRVLNGIQLTVISHACVDTAFAVVNLVLETACDSTDPATCADNLIREINEALVSVCTEAAIDSGTVTIDGLEIASVSHPCVDKVFGVVVLVLETACGSADAATCAENLLDRVQALVISVCTDPLLDTGAGPVTVNGVEVTNVSHPCVEAAYDVAASILEAACRSADAATCAGNLLDQINDLLITACETVPLDDSGEPLPVDGVAVSHPCVDAIFVAVDLVVSTICGSQEAEPCVQALIAQIGQLLNDACAAGPAPTSPLTGITGDVAGVVSNECVEKALEVVNLILSVVCDDEDAAECSTGLLEDVSELIAVSCGVTTGVDSPDPHACAQAVLDLLMTVIPDACTSAGVELALVDCPAPVAAALAELIEAALEQVNATVVDFQVYPRRIDPPAGAGPNVVNVYAQVTLGAWRVEVRDANGQPVRVFPGFTGLTTVTWDGRDAIGNVVPDGAYEVALLAPDDDAAVNESAWVFVGPGPSIGGLFPSNVSIGESLTIAGSGFTRGLGAFGVTIGHEEAPVLSWSDSSVVVQVPPSLDPGTYDLTLTAADAEATMPVTIKNHIPVTGSNRADVIPGVIRVQLKAGASMGAVAAAVGDAVFEPSAPPGYPELASWYNVTVPEGAEGSRVQAYASRPEVAFAGPIMLSVVDATPNDRKYGSQWYLKVHPQDADIDAPEAWNIRKGNSTLTVGVLDTQVGAHQDLDIVSVDDYRGTCAHSLPSADHGTFVAGQAAARTNNVEGVAGVAWGARVREYRLGFTTRGDCYIGEWTNALLLAAQRDDVVNMSFGRYHADPYEQRAIDSAWDRGLLMAASAGNDGSTLPHFPSSYDHVVSVGALNQSNRHATFGSGSTNRGPEVDVYAPGVEATSTTRKDDGSPSYESGWQGTSMASPLVAGALALLRAHAPTVPPANLVYALESTTQGTPARISVSSALRNIIRITLPSGIFVRTSTSGPVWFLDEGGVKRRVGSRVLLSWGFPSASSSQVPVVRPELLEIGYPATEASLGFRPGTLLRQGASGTTYVVTTDGTAGWRKGLKRPLSPEVLLCLHYDEARVVEVGKSELDLHQTGASVGCDRHPNGTLIKTPVVGGTETLEVLVDGQRRKFLTTQLAGSWGYTKDAVLPAPGDLLLPAGPNMGFRPGKILRNGGKLWVVTAGGSDFARATARQFSTATSINCYRLQSIPRLNATAAELALHAKGSGLGC